MGGTAYRRPAISCAWLLGEPHPNEFFLPHEVFELGLGHGPLLVYLYLICRKSSKHSEDKMSCTAISKAVGLGKKTVRAHLHTLAETGFIRLEHHGHTFSYTLCPVHAKVRERGGADPRKHWMSTKRSWLTGEVFNAVFSVPNEAFQLGLKPGELLVYIYLQYQKGVRSGRCWPSYATIGAAVGMSRKTVQKHVWALVDKGLIQTEDTTIRRRDGRSYNGSLLYTIKPIEQLLKEREKELLAELKLVEAQRKWAQKVKLSESAV